MRESIAGDESSNAMTADENTQVVGSSSTPHSQTPDSTPTAQKPRFGLPQNFVPRFQRAGRFVLLDENIYSLPNGREFVPSTPKGPLAGDRHLYALVTVEQFGRGSRGSVFVTLDGRVFDYSVVQTDPDREMFDTGYTIHHLKRTGRYASSVPIKKTDRQKTLKKKAGV
jgi:hypothetical protein